MLPHQKERGATGPKHDVFLELFVPDLVSRGRMRFNDESFDGSNEASKHVI